MSRVSDYAFINAKLRARIGIIRSSHLLDEMIKSPSLAEAVSKLDGTRHGHIAEVYRTTGDLQQAELSMMEDEIASYREIASYLPAHSAHFITVLLEKVEMDNLKNALRLWYSDVVRHHIISFRSAYVCRSLIVHSIDYDKIMNAESYQEMIRAFSGTPYEAVLSRFSLDILTEKGLFPLEIALDHLWFAHLEEALRHLQGDDRKLAEKIYSVDVDLKNILMLTRYSYYFHLPHDQLKDVLIPMGYISSEIERLKAYESDDPMAVIKGIVQRRYPQISEEIAAIRGTNDDLTAADENASQILRIEAYLADRRKSEYMKLLVGKPFSIGVVLSYFFLCKGEDSLVSAVLSAKNYKWSETKIREALGL